MKKLLFMLLATVLSLTQMVAQGVLPITVGTGTSSNTSGPIPGYFGNHRSIQLFTAAELGQEGACVVDSIALELGSVTAGTGGRAVRIYMKEVADTTVAGSQVIGTLTDGAVLVYSSAADGEVCTSNTWHTFVLETPFIYSGSNSLMIIFEGEGCSTSGGCAVNVKYTFGTNKAWTKCWDTTVPDFTTPVTNSNTFRANTRFYVSEMTDDYCYPVSALAVSNITSSGADISWESNPSSTTFAVEYKLATDTDWTLASNTISDNSYALSDLEVFSDYQVKVYSVCGDETSSAQTISFRTSPDASIMLSIPYTQNFDDPTDVTNWNFYSSAINAWKVGTAANNTYGDDGELTEGGALYISNDNGVNNSYDISTTTTAVAWAFVNLEEGNRYGLSFDWNCGGEGTADYFRVFLLPTSYEFSSTVPAASYSITGIMNFSNGWQNYGVEIPASYTGQYKLALMWRNDFSVGTQPAITIDNLNLYQLACSSPDTTLVTVTDNSASIEISDNNNNAEYTVEYRIKGSSTWSSVTSSSPVELTDLAMSSVYEYRVTAICNGSDVAIVSDIETFKTPCDVISDFPWFEGFENTWNSEDLMTGTITAPYCWLNVNGGGSSYKWESSSSAYEGNRVAYMYGYYSSSDSTATYKNDDWLITPVLELTGGEVLNFYAKKTNDTHTPELRIYAYALTDGDMTSGADTANFVAIDSLVNLTTSYLEYEIDLRSLSGQYRLAFVRNKTYGHGPVYVDNVTVKAASACGRPEGLAVTNVTDTEISVAWNEVEGVSSYNLYYKTSGAADWTVLPVTESSYILSGLPSATAYTIDVTSVCGDGTETGFTLAPSLSVATLCSAYPVPFVEDFTTFPSLTSMTSCWKGAKGFLSDIATTPLTYGSTSWSSQTKAGILSGSQHAKLNIYKTATTNPDKYDWLISPSIDLGDGSTQYDLKFSLAFTKFYDIVTPETCTNQKFMVLISQNGGSTWDSIDALTWEAPYEGQTTQDLSQVSPSGQIIKVNLTELGYTGNVMIGFYGEQREMVANQDNDLHIGNVKIEEHTECADMLSMTAEANSPTTIMVNWAVDPNVESAWTLAYTEGTTITPGAEGVETVSVPHDATLPYQIDNLTPNTTYTFAVQYDCGGSWSNPVTVTTPQSAATIPYTCDFEDEEENASWTLINGTMTTKWFIGAETATPEEHKLYLSSDNGATLSYDVAGTKIVYATRNIQFGNAAFYKITFDYKGGGEGNFDYVKVGLFRWDTTFSASTSIPTWAGASTVQPGFTYSGGVTKFNLTNGQVLQGEIFVDGSTVANSVKQLVFAWKQDYSMGDGIGVQIDNISIIPINCASPTDIDLAEDGATANSLTFDIEAEAGGQWEIQYKAHEATEWQSYVTTSLEGNVIDDLISGTMYDVRVRTLCNEDSSLFVPNNEYGYYLFATKCENITVTEETPFIENFDAPTWYRSGNITSSGSFAPMCWININGKHSSYNWNHSSSTSDSYNGSAGHLYMYNSTYASADTISDWFITPIFDLAGNETLSFFAKKSGSTDETLKIMYYNVNENEDMTSRDDTSSFALLQSITINSTDYTAFDIPLTDLTGSYRLAFYVSAPGAYIRIDDVMLSVSNCSRPQVADITVVPTASSATVNIADETNTAWIVYYKQASDEEYTAVPASTTEVTLTDLTATTQYSLYVVGDCGTSQSAPSSVINFRTRCFDEAISEFPYSEGFENGLNCWDVSYTSTNTYTYQWTVATSGANPTCTPHSGSNLVKYQSYNAGSGSTSTMISSGFNFSQSMMMKFWMYRTTLYATNNDRVLVYINNLPTEENATLLTTVTLHSTTTGWEEQEVMLPANTSETQYIIFKAISGYGGSIHIDDITIDYPPSCTKPDVASVTVSDITTNTASISWTDNNENNSSWNVYYRVAGSTEEYSILNVSEQSADLTGLTSTEDYEVFVKTACDDGEESDATNTVIFTTLQEAEQIPYTCDFEAEGSNGWLLKNGTCTNKWHVGTPSGATNASLYITNDNGTTAAYTLTSASVVVAEKLFQTGASDSLTISFDLTIGGESSYDYLKVYWVNADTVYTAAAGTTPYYGSRDYTSNVIMNNATYASYRFVNLLAGTQTMSVTIANEPNTLKKLVFVWRNDSGSGNGNGAIIDNLSIVEAGNTPEPCDAPTALTTSNITETSADVSWNGTASSYEVRLNSGTPETVTATSKTLTGLTAGTAYTVEVRAVCENSQSAWVSTSFTTTEAQVDPCDAPTALTASNITQTSAEISWNGTATGYEVRLNGGTPETVTATSKTLTGLTAGTAYTVEVRAVCESSQSPWVSTSFTTQNESGITAPTVNTLAATEVTHEAATLNGTITAGSEAITAQGFMYKASSAADWTTVAATGENITATLSNLTAETAYEYKAFATTASGTVEGLVMNFTTLEAPVVVTPPTVETLAASNITDNGATLNGTITAGSEEITAQGFMYKASSAADWTTVAATGENITATLSNLTAETAYEYKAFATTASGTVEGQIMSFTTLATSGLADAESGAIKAMIYPNPAKDKATLSLTGLTANAKIIVSDLQGRIIQTEDLQAGSETYELNTSNYASGVYYIRILCGNNVNTQKLIVE